MGLDPRAVETARLYREMRKHADEKRARTDIAHLRMAFSFALSLSRDPSTKVGALILAPDGRKVSMGYNGMVAGVDETDLWEERETKYKHVLHAEVNAILNRPFDVRGATIYCTLAPCAQCLKAIVQSGVRRVVHYGELHPRLQEPEVFDRLKDMVEWARYDDDPIIEGMKSLYVAQALNDGGFKEDGLPTDGQHIVPAYFGMPYRFEGRYVYYSDKAHDWLDQDGYSHPRPTHWKPA